MKNKIKGFLFVNKEILSVNNNYQFQAGITKGGGGLSQNTPLRSKISKIPLPWVLRFSGDPPPLAASRSKAAFCRNLAILLAIFGNFGNLRIIID